VSHIREIGTILLKQGNPIPYSMNVVIEPYCLGCLVITNALRAER